MIIGVQLMCSAECHISWACFSKMWSQHLHQSRKEQGMWPLFPPFAFDPEPLLTVRHLASLLYTVPVKC